MLEPPQYKNRQGSSSDKETMKSSSGFILPWFKMAEPCELDGAMQKSTPRLPGVQSPCSVPTVFWGLRMLPK